MIRFANPVEPSSSQPLIPSFGLKFLRDNVDSANLLSQIRDTDGQKGEWNFFSRDFVNHIGKPKTLAPKTLTTYLATETDHPLYVGLSDFAKYDQKGTKYPHPKFPFSLRWEAHSDLKGQRFIDEANTYAQKIHKWCMFK